MKNGHGSKMAINNAKVVINGHLSHGRGRDSAMAGHGVGVGCPYLLKKRG